jgi:hypothetical protein
VILQSSRRVESRRRDSLLTGADRCDPAIARIVVILQSSRRVESRRRDSLLTHHEAASGRPSARIEGS